jgi:tight adherence protein C
LYLAPVNIISKLLLTRFKIEDKIRDRLLVGRVTLTSSDFFSLKLIFAVLVFAGIFASGLGNSYPVALGIGPLIGFVIPDFWLQKKITARKEAIGKILPEMVDLMGLCFDAGLDFTLAIKWLLDKLRPNAVLEELSFILEEIHWGKPRTQALKDMSRRLSIPEISSFVQTLTLAERMGTPVALAFTILSEDMRMHRFHRGERIAMKAPIKILFPLVFFILPVIGIVIGGPIILQFMESGMSKTIGG